MVIQPLKHMDEEKENSNSENEELDELEELETTTEDNDSEEVTALKDKNRQLFARAKKAEGFEQKDGKWVKKEEKPVTPEPEVKPETQEEVTGLTQEDVEAQVTKTLEQRDLESLDISDELKKEVSDYGKLHSVSVKKALESDYIKFKRGQEDGETNADNASIGGGTRSATTVETTGADFDLTTDKGKEDFNKWEDEQRKALG